MEPVQRQKIVYPIGMLDYFKGAGMILIILCHCRRYSPAIPAVSRIIDETSSGALLFFFLAAGFGLRRTKPVKMLIKTAGEELLPYVFCGISSVLLIFPARWIAGDLFREALGKSGKAAAAFLLGYLGSGKTIFGIPIGTIGPAWFFPALFWGIQIVNFLIRTENQKLQVFLAVFLTGAGYLLSHCSIGWFCLARGLQAVLPVYMGYVLRTRHCLDRIPKIVSVALPAFLIGYPLLIYPYTKNSLWIVRGCARYLFRVCGVIFVVLLSIRYCRRKGNLIAGAIRYVGRNSFLYLVIHTIEYECVPWGGVIRILGLSEITEAGNILCFLARFCGCAVTVRIIEKPFKKLITDAPKSRNAGKV